MSLTVGSITLMLGLAMMCAAQIGIALHAFTGNPIKGLLCILVPFYVYVYARRHQVGIWLLRFWYLGITVFVLGAVTAS
jgi:hypothetical protein